MKLSNFLDNFEPIKILDIGSKAYLSNSQNYHKLSHYKSIGIDFYNEEELSISLKKSGFDNLISAVIGDGSTRELNICEFESCSSLLKPNQRLLSNFQHLSEWLKVKDKTLVETEKLDDIKLPFQPDFIKSDIQGSDIHAINYGKETFSTAVAVEIEVEFIQQYENQPLFSEIELLLRKQGFIFHTFTGYGSRLLKPANDEKDPYRTLNQWMWSHAVFFKDFLNKNISEEEYFKALNGFRGVVRNTVFPTTKTECFNVK
uniref:FkbM family methyltransferase n=1 Tax=Candidatus Sororendozoicomonas aggregata TaxID=3073239 RepID=UPI002ED2D85A